MNIQLNQNGFEKQAEIFRRKISERIPAQFGREGMQVTFRVDASLGESESYEILHIQDGYEIIGADILGLSHGIGKFLHTAKWSESDFVPSPPGGLHKPACTFRAMYFSVHNYNWYHTATTEELEEYLEEMVLWGYNAIHCIVPVLNITTIGDEMFKMGVEKARRLYLLARKLGMKTSLGTNPNQGLLGSPHEFDADQTYIPWKGGRNLCPSNPAALEHLKTIWRAKFESFLDIGLDFIHTWPYDEGGCSCKKCWPWGAKGYGDLNVAFHEEAVKYYPDAKFIIGTWCFEEPVPDSGEYEGFYKRLNGDLSWADYIMVDAHGDFPNYVLQHDVVKPVVNFPEISMWCLYPWGGFGANPLPKRFQRIWNSSKHVLKGGMPYSEGIYEDILKIQFAGYYWEPDKPYQEILAEYINYEYSPDVIPQVLEIMELIEKNHAAGAAGKPIDLKAAYRAKELACEVDAQLSDRAKKGWRWRILFIRTILDVKRYEFFVTRGMNGEDDYWTLRRRSAKFIEQDVEAQKLMYELCDHYHCVEYNGKNRWTHPPVGGGDEADTLKVALKEVDG